VENTFFFGLKPEKRRGLRKLLEQQRAVFVKERDLIDKSIAAVIRERIELVDRLLKNDVSIEYYVKRQAYLNKYVTTFFQYMGKSQGGD
jgi:hypothetical protein